MVYTLEFPNAAIEFLRQAYAKARPKFAGYGPWDKPPSILAYNALWQDWAGKWVTVQGSFTKSDTLAVRTLQVTKPEKEHHETTQSPNKSQMVILEGPITDEAIVYGSPADAPNRGGFFVWFTDIDGKTSNLLILDLQMNNLTQYISKDGQDVTFEIVFDGLSYRWLRFTGWKLNPPYSEALTDVVFVQSIMEIEPISTPNKQ
jgi:hypothetical protein